MKISANVAKILRYVSRTILLTVSVFLFVFSLLSGAENYGGGLKGILANSPNALPWVFLFVLIYIAWKWELTGGILIASMGIFTIFFFNALESSFVLYFVSIPLIILGTALIISWYLTKKLELK